ncbi:probable peroxisomal membrane protein PEX13 [Glossina fuscipes]|uniref:Peroxisomal membrane protein PEX13 n=1 Tax=Glossina fuscipes TaxID=7396 RepID=A0A9C6DIQ6_9MUSC|nr:probable peroxisomal membrane protein PEX13 [Glossina fuscipes]
MTDSGISNFRSPIINEANLLPPSWLGGGVNGGMHSFLRTPAGNVRAVPPPLPLAPTLQHNYGSGYGFGHNNNWCNGAFTNGGFGGYGYGNNFGSYGFGYNRFGNTNPLDPEARFIQLAEATSRPAFQSIESLVMAVGNIASMLDSTFFAITSSFRAILGVAANFGRLRGVFSQFWHTFAIFRTLNWIYRKLLYWLRISNLESSSESFRKAYTEAINETSSQQGAPKLPRKSQSPWPVLAFISFIFTAPYLIMKMLGTISNTAHEEACQPTKWIRPVETSALYDFQSRNSNELTIHAGQRMTIAPKEIQNTLGLLNTGWALATTDGQNVGIIPINYVKSPQQQKQEQEQQFLKPIATDANLLLTETSDPSISCKPETNLNNGSQSVDASVLPNSVKENI